VSPPARRTTPSGPDRAEPDQERTAELAVPSPSELAVAPPAEVVQVVAPHADRRLVEEAVLVEGPAPAPGPAPARGAPPADDPEMASAFDNAMVSIYDLLREDPGPAIPGPVEPGPVEPVPADPEFTSPELTSPELTSPEQQQTARGNRDALSSLAATVGRRTKKVAGKAGSRVRSASSGAAERVQDAAAQVDVEAVKQAAGAQVRSTGQAADAEAGTTRKAAQQAGTRGRAAAATGGRMAAEAAVRAKEAVSDVDLAPLGEQLRGLAGLVSLTPRTTQRASALLPGRVAGIELDEEQLTVHLTAAYGTRLPQLAVQVHEAARPYAGQRRTLVEVVALEQPDDPTAPAAAEAPERQRASTGGTGAAGSATDVLALPAPAPRRDDGEPVHDDAALAVRARPSARGRGRQKAPVCAKSDRPDASAPGPDPRSRDLPHPDLPHPDLPHPDLPHPDLPGGTP